MKFPFEDLYYLKARGADDRRPAEAWGGYGTPLQENDKVYTAEEVEMLPCTDWLLNGIADGEHMSHQLLIFDLDVYKAPDDFDIDRITVPDNTPIVKSQRGGLHIYFAVNTAERGQESDFQIADELPFGIDIRGEYVKHHVAAPSDLPGVVSSYELVQDATISHVFDPAEAAATIEFDGEPAITHKSSTDGVGGGYERDEIDPPADLPKCYAAALSLRQEAPEDNNLNTHSVNVHAALCGLGSGYSVEKVVDHFVDEYYPGDPAHADRERTTYHVEHIAEKLDSGQYAPSAVGTLQDVGILPHDEHCTCGLPGHTRERQNRSDYFGDQLKGVARAEGYGDPFGDNLAMLRACLKLREEADLSDAKPPYAALQAVADVIGLNMEDPDEGILGKSTYKVARRIFDDLEPGDI